VKRVVALVTTFLLGIVALVTFLILKRQHEKANFMLTVSLPEAPYSFDPIDHDWAVHHATQRAVLATLITNYTLGRVSGILARSWEVSTDRKQWKFKIKKGLTFSNGEPLDAESVRKSFTRMAYLMQKSGSTPGLLEHLKGFDNIESASSPFEGIRTLQENEVVFDFVRPVEDALEQFAFGTYGVVHPTDFDAVSGGWKDTRTAIASGQFEIANFAKESLNLVRRETSLFDIGDKNPYAQINIMWPMKTESDLVLSSGFDDPPRPGLRFHGGLESEIYYYRILSWPLKNSVLADRETRRALRDRFYFKLEGQGRKPVRSFLPPSLPGIGPAKSPALFAQQKDIGKGDELRILDYRSRGGWRESACNAIFAAAADLGFTPKFVESDSATIQKQRDSTLAKYEYDVSGAVTGIYTEAPREGLRFMVQAREGIRLPDPSGRLNSIVSTPDFSIQDFNEALWDEALIWPVTHGATGLWVDDTKVDASGVDFVQPPTEISLFGRR